MTCRRSDSGTWSRLSRRHRPTTEPWSASCEEPSFEPAGRGSRGGMKVVITGASGNIGSAVQRELASATYDVLAVARRRPTLRKEHRRVGALAAADVRHDDLDEVFAGADAVVHLAWMFQPTRRPEVTWGANAVGRAGCWTPSLGRASRPWCAPRPSRRTRPSTTTTRSTRAGRPMAPRRRGMPGEGVRRAGPGRVRGRQPADPGGPDPSGLRVPAVGGQRAETHLRGHAGSSRVLQSATHPTAPRPSRPSVPGGSRRRCCARHRRSRPAPRDRTLQPCGGRGAATRRTG